VDAIEAHDIQTPERLLKLDHQRFWRTVLRFSRPPSIELLAKKVAKRRSKEGGRTVGRDTARRMHPERIANALVRANSDKDGRPIAHDLYIALKLAKSVYGTRPQKFFEELDPACMVPRSPNNALW
jgi:hypothetical protein